MAENVDLLIKGWYVVTMNQTRDIIHDGAVAIRGNQIVAVGKASDLEEPITTAAEDRRRRPLRRHAPAWSTPTSTSPASR